MSVREPVVADGRGCENPPEQAARSLPRRADPPSLRTLRFTNGGVRPRASSSGTTTIPAGVVYGQGRRCLGGVLDRLYTKNAAGGSIAAPGPGDPSVSARSSTLGSPISAGQNRFYLVFYRDPFVLGGCPLASGFNATQGGRVTWAP
jgi:hypothetical protein